jgi:hypothetical protein
MFRKSVLRQVRRLFILQSVLRQVRSLFQSEFSTECDLVVNFKCLEFYPFLKVIQQLLTSSSSSSLHFYPSITCFRRQFLRKMWPIQLAFLLFIACTIFHSSCTLCNPSNYPISLTCLTRFPFQYCLSLSPHISHTQWQRMYFRIPLKLFEISC